MKPHPEIAALLSRSNRLGSDKRFTNFAGGNTSAKLEMEDPVTGRSVQVLAVKGSGGDLGTLTERGLAFLDLDRVRALEQVHAGGVHEDDIVEMYALCRFGLNGTVPSIDTPLHAFVDVAHVDHLHPDSVIALAASADGEQLVNECFQGEVGWMDWLRPGLELGLAIRDFRLVQPAAVGVVMGGHGMICWAATSDECEAVSRSLIERAERFLVERGDSRPFGPVSPIVTTRDERREEAARIAPRLRGLASRDRLVVGQFTDAHEVLEFLASERAPELVELGTSCPDHFLRTKIKPLLVTSLDRLDEAHQAYRSDYAAYYHEHATPDSPAMRGADPSIILVPGVGMWSFGIDAQTARVAGEFYINAINVMRGAESVSSYTPISDAEKFRIEYWELEERKLRMRPEAPRLLGRVALVAGGASGIGRAIVEKLAGAGACVVVADRNIDESCRLVADLEGGTAIAVQMDVSDECSVAAGFAAAHLEFGGVDLVVNSAGFARSARLLDTTVDDWDNLHDVLARGSFLVTREAARSMIDQGVGGDIVHIVSKNGVVAGPQNIAYSAAKADQAHQVRLAAAELGEFGIRVNGVNPDGVVQGSGIFSGEWLEKRAETYGVLPGELGQFYASRTILGHEVLPSHVADAVMVLISGDLGRTTGLTVPVDSGLAPAFLR